MREHIRILAGSKDILFTWTVRELKVRYADTRLGVAWLLLYPAGWVVLFTVLFSRLMPVPVRGAPYPLFVMSGLAPWFFFSNSIGNAVTVLKNNAQLIPRIYFPREIFPLGSVLAGLIDLLLYACLLVAMMLFYRTGGGPILLLLLPVTGVLAAFTLAVALMASWLGLFRRDVQVLVQLGLPFLMYCLPVFYPAEIVPARFRTLYLLNPLAALMDSFRRILVYGTQPQWFFLTISASVSALFLVLAYWGFKRAEPEFADRL